MTKMKKIDLDELRRELSAYLEENYTGCGDEQADELIANNKLSYFAYMAKAGYTFSTALIQDLVVKFFIQEGIFDVDAVNVELYKLGKKPLTNQRVSS